MIRVVSTWGRETDYSSPREAALWGDTEGDWVSLDSWGFVPRRPRAFDMDNKGKAVSLPKINLTEKFQEALKRLLKSEVTPEGTTLLALTNCVPCGDAEIDAEKNQQWKLLLVAKKQGDEGRGESAPLQFLARKMGWANYPNVALKDATLRKWQGKMYACYESQPSYWDY